MPTTLEDDLRRLAEQEERLVLDRFDADTAWQVGERLRTLARERGQAVTIEIRIARETVFFHAMPGTAPGNADWARRKRNSVELLQQSSYRIGRTLEKEGSSLEEKMGLPLRDHAHAGGAVPVRVKGVGCIGVVTVSGLPQRADHHLVIEVLAPLAGLRPAEIALVP
jgi:uncharacterized protein (UPF0303 family)